MWTLATKEFRDLLYSPKYLLLFAVSAALILISVFNGYAAYSEEMASASLSEEVAISDAESLGSYVELERQGLRVGRFPSKMSVFNLGISGVVGRKGLIQSGERPRARDSRFSLDPVLAVFGQLDLTFTVGLILSLFAILFSYNAFSGERENGTLRLMMANPVGRASVVLGKLLGGFLPLALLFLLPFLAAIAGLLLLTDVRFTAAQWGLIAAMALAALFYLLIFYSMGMAMSALTNSSFVSFLLCLFLWVLSVAIVPKAAVQVASLVNPSMSIDEVESEILAYKNSRKSEWPQRMERYFQENPLETTNNINDILMGIGEQLRAEIRAEDEEYQDNLFNEYALKREQMMNSAVGFARVSPTSCFAFSMNSLADTGPQMLDGFEGRMLQYRRSLGDYLKQQKEQFGENAMRPGSVAIMQGPAGISIRFDREDEASKLDLSGMPRLQMPQTDLAEAGGAAVLDMALMALFAICFFALTFVAFLRYDVR